MIQQLIYRGTAEGYRVVALSAALAGKGLARSLQALSRMPAGWVGKAPIYSRTAVDGGVAIMRTAVDPNGTRNHHISHICYVPREDLPAFSKGIAPADHFVDTYRDTRTVDELPAIEPAAWIDAAAPKLDCFRALFGENADLAARFIAGVAACAEPVQSRSLKGVCALVPGDAAGISPAAYVAMETLLRVCPGLWNAGIGYRTLWTIPENNVQYPVFFTTPELLSRREQVLNAGYLLIDVSSGEFAFSKGDAPEPSEGVRQLAVALIEGRVDATLRATETIREEQRQVKLEAQRRAEEQARIEAQKRAEEQARIEAQRRAEEQARIEAQKRAEEQARIEAQRRAEEQARIEAQKRAEEQARIEAQRRAEEQARIEAQKRAEEQARIEAQKRAEEQARIEAQKRAEEQARIEAQRRAEEQARIEAQRRAEEQARIEALKRAEEQARIEAQRRAEEQARIEAQKRAEEQARIEAQRRAEEQARVEAEARVEKTSPNNADRETYDREDAAQKPLVVRFGNESGGRHARVDASSDAILRAQRFSKLLFSQVFERQSTRNAQETVEQACIYLKSRDRRYRLEFLDSFLGDTAEVVLPMLAMGKSPRACEFILSAAATLANRSWDALFHKTTLNGANPAQYDAAEGCCDSLLKISAARVSDPELRQDLSEWEIACSVFYGEVYDQRHVIERLERMERMKKDRRIEFRRDLSILAIDCAKYIADADDRLSRSSMSAFFYANVRFANLNLNFNWDDLEMLLDQIQSRPAVKGYRSRLMRSVKVISDAWKRG